MTTNSDSLQAAAAAVDGSAGLRRIRAACWLIPGMFVAYLLAFVLGGKAINLSWGWMALMLVIAWLVCIKKLKSARRQFLLTAALPSFLKRKLREHYPHLSGADADLVERGLRDFFVASLDNKGQFIAMPSQAVDVMWHEFILHTQAYKAWCTQGLGRFLHHTPAEALGKSAVRNDGLRRVWFWACRQVKINPRKPTHLPLLFAIDKRLNIADGFYYTPDCRNGVKKASDGSGSTGCGGQCATDFSSDSYSGSGGDFGGAETSSADAGSNNASSTDGGGGGDSGCGSGCGGGGGD